MADSDALQLASALLLTMSNLLFIPAILLATYKRFWVQSLCYAYTMILSSVSVSLLFLLCVWLMYVWFLLLLSFSV